MLAYDVFANDDWSALEVTEAANDIVYIPEVLADMNIYEIDPIRTIDVGVYKDTETLELVPITERGTEESMPGRDVKSLVKLPGIALRQRDRIDSREIQGMFASDRGMSLDEGLANAWDEVDRRQRKLIRKLELTREYHRFAGLQGFVLDADGSIVIDLFEEFGYSQPNAIIFDFDALVDGDLRKKVGQSIIEPMRLAGRGSFTSRTSVGGLVGSDFFYALLGNAEYRDTFKNIPAASQLLEDKTWQTVDAFGVRWMNYRGTDDGSTISVASDEAKFFPINAEGVFKEFRMPGEDWTEVNERGREFYSKVSPDYRPNMMEWVDVFLRAYPLFICTKPNTLLRAKLA